MNFFSELPLPVALLSSRNLLFWKKRSATITDYDPTYKVLYLGNILTPWAKGIGCEEKPLQSLWKMYNKSRSHVPMELTVCNSGIKVLTKSSGLTEYWAYRVSYCCAPKDYPGVFCWVYRHEKSRMRQEYRFHAALCSKTEHAQELVNQLNDRLAFALQEFRREKLTRQKARLSLANSCYDCPSMPRRKLLLYRGTMNFRPPVEMSKIAPKLTDIEEVQDEEEEEAKFFNLLNSNEVFCFDYSSSLDSSSDSSGYGSPGNYSNSSADYYSSTSEESSSFSSSSDEQTDDSIVDLSEHALLLLS